MRPRSDDKDKNNKRNKLDESISNTKLVFLFNNTELRPGINKLRGLFDNDSAVIYVRQSLKDCSVSVTLRSTLTNQDIDRLSRLVVKSGYTKNVKWLDDNGNEIGKLSLSQDLNDLSDKLHDNDKYDLVLSYPDVTARNNNCQNIRYYIGAHFTGGQVIQITNYPYLLCNLGDITNEIKNKLPSLIKYLNKKGVQYKFQNKVASLVQQIELPITNTVNTLSNSDNTDPRIISLASPFVMFQPALMASTETNPINKVDDPISLNDFFADVNSEAKKNNNF